LKDNNSGVKLSTVHRVKGLEAERVYLLKQTFARHICLRGDEIEEPIQDEELNIEYVGITRGKTYIGWINIEDRDEPALLADDVSDLETDELEPALDLAERAASLAHAAGRAARVQAIAKRSAAILDRLRG
jgi:superfamily I DNA/RNA helicase